MWLYLSIRLHLSDASVHPLLGPFRNTLRAHSLDCCNKSPQTLWLKGPWTCELSPGGQDAGAPVAAGWVTSSAGHFQGTEAESVPAAGNPWLVATLLCLSSHAFVPPRASVGPMSPLQMRTPAAGLRAHANAARPQLSTPNDTRQSPVPSSARVLSCRLGVNLGRSSSNT